MTDIPSIESNPCVRLEAFPSFPDVWNNHQIDQMRFPSLSMIVSSVYAYSAVLCPRLGFPQGACWLDNSSDIQSAEGAGGFGLIEGDQPSTGASGDADASYTQGDGALGASPSTGVGAEPQAATDTENAAKPGGAVHGYNE